MTAYSSTHASKPSTAELIGNNVTFLNLNTNSTSTPVKIQVNGVDKLTVSNTGVNSTVPFSTAGFVNTGAIATTTLEVSGTTVSTGVTNTGNIATTTLGVSGLTTTTGITNTGNVQTTALNATGINTGTLYSSGYSTLTGVANTGDIATTTLGVSGLTTTTGITNTGNVQTTALNATGINTGTLYSSGYSTLTGVANTGDIATTTLGVSGLTTTTGITNTGNVQTTALNAVGINTGTLYSSGFTTLTGIGNTGNTSTTTLGVSGLSTTTGITNTGDISTTTLNVGGINTTTLYASGLTSTSNILNTGYINTSTTLTANGYSYLTGVINTGDIQSTTVNATTGINTPTLYASSTVPSTTPSTGGLVVAGGAGVLGDVNVAGIISGAVQATTLNCSGNSTFTGTSLYNGIFVDTNTTDATASLLGSVVNYGGTYTAKNVWANTGVVIPYGQALKTIGQSVGNKYLDVDFSKTGGLPGDATYLYTPGDSILRSSNDVDDYVLAANKEQVKLKQTTASTSTTTGALIIPFGGMGIGGNLNVGGTLTAGSVTYGTTASGTFAVTNGTGTTLTVASTEESTSTTTGGSIFDCGVAIKKNLHVGGTITGGSVTYGTTTSGTFAVTNGSGTTLTVASTDEITSDTTGGGASFEGGVRIAKRLATLGPIYSPYNYLSGGTLGAFAGTYFYKEGTRTSGSPWSFGRSVEGLSDQDNMSLKYFGSSDTDTRNWIAYPEGQTSFKSLAQKVFTVTTATTTQLLKGDGTIIVCTAGSGVGVVKLPPADTLGAIGVTYTLHNQHLTPWYVQNWAGTGIATMFKPGDTLIITLMNNATGAGVWQVVLDTSLYAKPNALVGDSPNYTPAVTITNTTASVGSSAVVAFLTPGLASNQETVLQLGQDNVRQLNLGFTNASLGEIFLGFPGGDQLRYKTNQLKIGDGNYFQYKYGTWTPVMWANYGGVDEFGFPYVPTALPSTFTQGSWERIGDRMTLYFEVAYSYGYFGANFQLFIPNIPFRPVSAISVEGVMSSLSEMTGAEKPLYARIRDTSYTIGGFTEVMTFLTVYGNPVQTLGGQVGQRAKGSISFTV